MLLSKLSEPGLEGFRVTGPADFPKSIGFTGRSREVGVVLLVVAARGGGMRVIAKLTHFVGDGARGGEREDFKST